MTETMARPQPSDRYTATSGRVQLTGIQALARLPIDQHRRDLAAGLKIGTRAASSPARSPAPPATG